MVWKYQSIPPNIPLLSTNVANLSSQLANQQRQIAALLGANNQGGSGGINLTEDFTNATLYPLGALPSAKWLTNGDPTKFGIFNPTGNGGVSQGFNGIYGDVAWYFNANTPGNVSWYAQYKTPFATDNQSVNVRLASQGQSNVGTWIFSHSDIAFTTSYVYARIYNNQIILGYAVWNGSVFVIHDQYTYSGSVSNGDSITLQNQGTNWSVYQNGSIVAVWTDTSGAIVYGSTNRYGGYSIGNLVSLISDTSFAISSITFSDIPPLNLKGIGWGVYRAATTSPGNLPSGVNQLLAGTLDTVSWSNGVTAIGTGGLGGYKLQFEGRYMFTQTYYIGGAIPGGNRAGAALYYQASGAGSPSVARIMPETVNPANFVGGVCTGYGYPGDIFYPGVYNFSFGMGIYGEVTGAYTRWEGIKIS